VLLRQDLNVLPLGARHAPAPIHDHVRDLSYVVELFYCTVTLARTASYPLAWGPSVVDPVMERPCICGIRLDVCKSLFTVWRSQPLIHCSFRWSSLHHQQSWPHPSKHFAKLVSHLKIQCKERPRRRECHRIHPGMFWLCVQSSIAKQSL
jgi:hypothetical protein